MKEYFEKSLKVIKTLKIKKKKEYNKLKTELLILNIESLKYITNKRNFREIVKLAEEVV